MPRNRFDGVGRTVSLFGWTVASLRSSHYGGVFPKDSAERPAQSVPRTGRCS
jgi:hypothetical protein